MQTFRFLAVCSFAAACPMLTWGTCRRRSFSYPVSFSDIEFNQVAMVRTTFEEAAVNAIEPLIQPLPAEVQSWVDQMDFAEWRERVQSQRRMSDAEFFKGSSQMRRKRF